MIKSLADISRISFSASFVRQVLCTLDELTEAAALQTPLRLNLRRQNPFKQLADLPISVGTV